VIAPCWAGGVVGPCVSQVDRGHLHSVKDVRGGGMSSMVSRCRAGGCRGESHMLQQVKMVVVSGVLNECPYC
jgi:hypothetical protein